MIKKWDWSFAFVFNGQNELFEFDLKMQLGIKGIWFEANSLKYILENTESLDAEWKTSSKISIIRI